MIVCSCNVFTDHDVRRAVESDTPQHAGQVYGCLGCSPQCGRCARTIRRIMDEALAAADVAEASCTTGCRCCPRGGPGADARGEHASGAEA